MEANLVNTIQAISIMALVAVYVFNVIKKIKESNTQTILDFASSLVEEGVAFSEHTNRILKREVASEAGKALKKQSVNMTKDPVAVEKYLQEALKPAREIAHKTAKDYIEKSIESIRKKSIQSGVKKLINNKTIDNAIKMRVSGPKCGMMDPLKALLFREI